MNQIATTFRTGAILLPLALLSACTTFESYWPGAGKGDALESIPVSERPVQEPIAANHFVLESPEQRTVGELQVVLTNESDTLSDLARAYGLGYDELVAANPGVDPWLPGDQTPILLPTRFVLPAVAREGIVLNIAAKRLFYFPAVPEGEAQVVQTYPIGIGRVGWQTPLGAATVIAKAVDPTWYVPQSVRQEHAEMGDPLPAVIGPGPDNPLGTRVLKLDMPGYLIHGTNQPYGVGMRVSHGCVRLYPENIEHLFELVAVGETVQIVNEPFLLDHSGDELIFEAHAPLEDDTLSVDDRLNDLFVRFGESAANELSVETERRIRKIVAGANGVPLGVHRGRQRDLLAGVRRVRNIVEPDPDAPTLSEVREMMNEVMQEDDQT